MASADELTTALDAFYERSLRPGFERLDARLEGLGERIDGQGVRIEGLGGRMERVESGIEGLGGRVERVEGRLGNVDGRLGSLEGGLGNVDGRLGSLEGGLGNVDGRLGSLEARVDQFATQVARRFQEIEARVEGVGLRLEAFRLEALDRFGDLYGKFGGLHDEYRLVVGALRRLEEAGTAARPSEIAGLAARLEEIDQRLRAVEARRDGSSDR